MPSTPSAVAPWRSKPRCSLDSCALDRLADTGVGRVALDAVPVAQLPAARAAVREVVAGYADADGIRMGAAVLITSARVPS